MEHSCIRLGRSHPVSNGLRSRDGAHNRSAHHVEVVVPGAAGPEKKVLRSDIAHMTEQSFEHLRPLIIDVHRHDIRPDSDRKCPTAGQRNGNRCSPLRLIVPPDEARR